jgi:hypothetical protein
LTRRAQGVCEGAHAEKQCGHALMNTHHGFLCATQARKKPRACALQVPATCN